MATRTFTNVDFINYSAGFTNNSGSNAGVATVDSNFNFGIATSGTSTADPPNGLEDLAVYTYEAEGDIDWTLFPVIPDNALISEVEVKIDISVTGTASSSSAVVGPPSPCTAGGIARGKVFLGVVELTDLSLTELDEHIGATPQTASISGFDHYTAEQVFDFTSSPIDKGALIVQFTSWLVQLEAFFGATADITGPVAGATNETLGFDFEGIRVTVTYESASSITLTPSGGPAETGQQIIAAGPDAADLTYAFVQDNLIIPIIPKIISQDEVWLEIPYPPTDPCFDCFGDCPDCEDCFTVCDEDLIGEACQACIDACLLCLELCLEDLQDAEECQQSTGTQTPPPVVVICGGPGFSGTVTLGNFVILTANGSGLYRFVLGKENDTLYTSERDGTTYDVKIPNPGAKTGFFRS